MSLQYFHNLLDKVYLDDIKAAFYDRFWEYINLSKKLPAQQNPNSFFTKEILENLIDSVSTTYEKVFLDTAYTRKKKIDPKAKKPDQIGEEGPELLTEEQLEGVVQSVGKVFYSALEDFDKIAPYKKIHHALKIREE